MKCKNNIAKQIEVKNKISTTDRHIDFVNRKLETKFSFLQILFFIYFSSSSSSVRRQQSNGYIAFATFQTSHVCARVEIFEWRDIAMANTAQRIWRFGMSSIFVKVFAIGMTKGRFDGYNNNQEFHNRTLNMELQQQQQY